MIECDAILSLHINCLHKEVEGVELASSAKASNQNCEIPSLLDRASQPKTTFLDSFVSKVVHVTEFGVMECGLK